MYYDLFFSIILSFALLAALFFCTSCRVGLITCFVSIVYWLSFARFLKWYFIIRSSILWNEIIAQRPPGASTVSNWLMKSSTCQNSLFVTILIHWKIGASSFFEILNSWRSFVNHVVVLRSSLCLFLLRRVANMFALFSVKSPYSINQRFISSIEDSCMNS